MSINVTFTHSPSWMEPLGNKQQTVVFLESVVGAASELPREGMVLVKVQLSGSYPKPTESE